MTHFGQRVMPDMLRTAVLSLLFLASARPEAAQQAPSTPTPANTQSTSAVPDEKAMAANGAGVGDLLVAPTRLILNSRSRTAELALINIGDSPATYRVSLVHMQMTPNGELKEVDTNAPGEQFADELLRFAPRQVTLDPHVVQTVRIQLRLPAQLAAGEYRAHLLFRGVPPVDTTVPPSDTTAQGGFSVKLTPVYGVSIPVIVRYGTTSASAALSEAKVVAGPPLGLQLKISRSGNQSVYGNITVRFAPVNGREKPQVVGIMNGVAVYTPLAWRSVTVPLQVSPGLSLEHGRLIVTYTDAEGTTGDVLGQTEIQIP